MAPPAPPAPPADRSRRRFLASAALAGSALWLRRDARAGVEGTALPALMVYDARFPAAVAQARLEAGRGVPVAGFDGDLTRLWRQRLDPAWRTRGLVVEGCTTGEALLCLRMLAQAHDLRVAWQRPLGGLRRRGAAPGLVRWRIAPRRPQGAGRTGNGTLQRSM